MRLELHVASSTHPGRTRELNEDHVCTLVRAVDEGPPLALLIVADGMGGHQAGEVASELAVAAMRRSLDWFVLRDSAANTQPLQPITAIEAAAQADEDADSHFLEKRLMLAVEAANNAIIAYGRNNPVDAGNLGSTITCALVEGELAAIANVGDSRTYLFRDGRLEQITEDHSYVGRLVRAGQLAADEIFDHPRRNLITRTLGHERDVVVDVWLRHIEPGDRLLLCSDGLWEMVRDEQLIIEELRQEPAVAVQNLVALANAMGGGDNIAVIVAEVRAS